VTDDLPAPPVPVMPRMGWAAPLNPPGAATALPKSSPTGRTFPAFALIWAFIFSFTLEVNRECFC